MNGRGNRDRQGVSQRHGDGGGRGRGRDAEGGLFGFMKWCRE